jgi:guanylate kinase
VEFEERVEAGEFLEHANVYGFRYGTLKRELTGRLAQGKDLLVSVDVQGAASIRAEAAKDARLGAALVTVFLAPPTLAELERRLRQRKTDAEEAVQRRLRAARRELERALEFDYIILSGTTAEDLERLLTIFRAEKLRSHRVHQPWKG